MTAKIIAENERLAKAASVPELIKQRSLQWPNAVAVREGKNFITYAELEIRTDNLASRLAQEEVAAETVVGLCLERSINAVVGMIGILKAGCVYMPMDPKYPPERLKFMLKKTNAPFVVTSGAFSNNLPQGLYKTIDVSEACKAKDGSASANKKKFADPSDSAFIIFTSGSTGEPKGVLLEHAGAVKRIELQPEIAEISEGSVVAFKTSICFVDSLFEILCCLAYGGELSVFDSEVVKDPGIFVAQLSARYVTHLTTVPALASSMAQTADLETLLPNLRYWILSGEVVTKGLAHSLSQALKSCSIINLYGSTEIGPDATVYVIDGSEQNTIPIGRPLSDVKIYIVNTEMQLVQTGEVGEICVASPTLARGYLRRSDLTDERFVHFSPASQVVRVFRTGDLGKFMDDGQLEFVGRRDQQVKLRGFRVELGEVEATMLKHEAVAKAAVVTREDEKNDSLLVGYYVKKPKSSLKEAELRNFLADHLPDYMVPSRIFSLERLPLTPSGKIDRLSLPTLLAPERSTSFQPPESVREIEISKIWIRLLDLNEIGIHDNFFELGGHSLLAVRMLAAVREELGYKVPIQIFFQKPTIFSLARLF